MEDEQSYVLSRYIVADPRICHGKLTFRGTRIMVSQILDQVADGLAWESIVEEWDGAIKKEAIADAVRLAQEALLTHVDDMRIRTRVAEPTGG